MSTQTADMLVEDDAADAFFFKRALTKARPGLPFAVVTDGQQGLDYLAGNLCYSDRTTYPVPSLVMLDLKLPYLSGFQVLEYIKSGFRFTSLHPLPRNVIAVGRAISVLQATS